MVIGDPGFDLWFLGLSRGSEPLLRGNRLEPPWFSGKVVELGRRHSIPTPVNGFIDAALKPYVNGPPA